MTAVFQSRTIETKTFQPSVGKGLKLLKLLAFLIYLLWGAQASAQFWDQGFNVNRARSDFGTLSSFSLAPKLFKVPGDRGYVRPWCQGYDTSYPTSPTSYATSNNFNYNYSG